MTARAIQLLQPKKGDKAAHTHALADAADDSDLILASELEALGKLSDLLEEDQALAWRLAGVVDSRREALDALSQVDETRWNARDMRQVSYATSEMRSDAGPRNGLGRDIQDRTASSSRRSEKPRVSSSGRASRVSAKSASVLRSCVDWVVCVTGGK